MEPKVTLVGAGPGDPELLTVKGLKAIEAAGVVVYDRLVSDEIMALVPRGVPKIYAGKSCKHKAMKQEEINDLLVMLAKKYARVVRLKGGDPFLFGRGGEEMLALAAANIPYEIIPGITSAQGCAAIAGIPLTHRGLATGVRFITGHTQSCGEASAESAGSIDPVLPLRGPQDINETLVIYMGLANLEEIVKNLLAQGLPGGTPAAIIERGTTPAQRVFATTLAALPERVKSEKIEPPSLVIIGKVAAMANHLCHPRLDRGPRDTRSVGAVGSGSPLRGGDDEMTVTELSRDFAAGYARIKGK